MPPLFLGCPRLSAPFIAPVTAPAVGTAGYVSSSAAFCSNISSVQRGTAPRTRESNPRLNLNHDGSNASPAYVSDDCFSYDGAAPQAVAPPKAPGMSILN